LILLAAGAGTGLASGLLGVGEGQFYHGSSYLGVWKKRLTMTGTGF